MPIYVNSTTYLHNISGQIINKCSCFSTSFSGCCSSFLSSSNRLPMSIKSCSFVLCSQSPFHGFLFTLQKSWIISVKRPWYDGYCVFKAPGTRYLAGHFSLILFQSSFKQTVNHHLNTGNNCFFTDLTHSDCIIRPAQILGTMLPKIHDSTCTFLYIILMVMYLCMLLLLSNIFFQI